MQIGGGTADAVNYPAGGAGGDAGVVIANVVLSFFLLLILWIPFVCLYPLTALAGIAAAVFTYPFLAKAIPSDPNVPLVAAIIVGAIAGGIVNRIEFRLAQNIVFRLGRHAVRLVLLAVWAIPVIMMAQHDVDATATRYILYVITNPPLIAQFLANPINDVILLVVVTGLHFLIWKAEGVRRFWHRRLNKVGLK